jgi:hypothetical protein
MLFIPCAFHALFHAYKDSLYADSQMDIPGSFQAMPGAASIISNKLYLYFQPFFFLHPHQLTLLRHVELVT